MTNLHGKLALVTGEAWGIGIECALALSKAGGSVIVNAIDDQLGHQAAKKVGAGASYLHLDVSGEADWRKAGASPT